MDEERYRQAEQGLWESVGVQPTERFVDLERTGAKVRVLEVGEGPPVLFVHGGSNGGTGWASLAARLRGFRCILLDRPGNGLSPPLKQGFSEIEPFRAFADDLVVDVLDALDVDAASVIGNSFGGYFALRTADAHPDRIDHLVSIGWSVGAPMMHTPMVMRVAMTPFLGRLATKIPPTERMARSMLKQIGLRGAIESGRFGPPEMAWFLSLLRDTDTMRNEIDGAPRLTTLRGFNEGTLLSASLLARVTCPALFIWGEDDPMGGAEIARTFVGQVPDATLDLMAKTGHAPWMDDPDYVAKRVEAFLSS